MNLRGPLKILVKQNLVACVNILGEAISIYKWAGAIQENIEVIDFIVSLNLK